MSDSAWLELMCGSQESVGVASKTELAKFHHPYEPYAIQMDFMKSLYATLESKKVGIFESPTGKLLQDSKNGLLIVIGTVCEHLPFEVFLIHLGQNFVSNMRIYVVAKRFQQTTV